MVKSARTLEICTYEEVAEIAHQGAKVVHPRAAEVAMDYNIPLWVKSTFSDAPGTRIADSHAPEESDSEYAQQMRRRLTGVTHTGKVVYIRLEIGDSVPHKALVEREVYRMMAQANVNIYFLTFSPRTLSFAVPRDVYPIARDLLDGMVVPVTNPEPTPEGKIATYYIFKFSNGQDLAYSVQRPLLKSQEKFIDIVDVPASVIENCTTVSVIAANHRRVPGVLAHIYETLTKAGIAVYQTADSEMSVSLLVSESEVERAVKLLHETLFEQ